MLVVRSQSQKPYKLANCAPQATTKTIHIHWPKKLGQAGKIKLSLQDHSPTCMTEYLTEGQSPSHKTDSLQQVPVKLMRLIHHSRATAQPTGQIYLLQGHGQVVQVGSGPGLGHTPDVVGHADGRAHTGRCHLQAVPNPRVPKLRGGQTPWAIMHIHCTATVVAIRNVT